MDIKQIISQVLRKAVLPYAKAWAVAGVFWVFGILAGFGLDVPQDVQTSVISAVTAFIVWLVPNIPYAE